MTHFDHRNDSDAAAVAAAVAEATLLVMRIVRSEVRKRRPDGLSVSALRALGYLKWHPGASLSDVSEHVGLGAPTTSKLVDDLVARGWVAREQDPADRRRLALRVLPAGRRKLEAVLEGAHRTIAERLAPLSAEEREAVRRAMALLVPLVRPSCWSEGVAGAPAGGASAAGEEA
ncbi:MAG TPA: MarR family transcriptional regulator [Longimicrobiales bacterium]